MGEMQSTLLFIFLMICLTVWNMQRKAKEFVKSDRGRQAVKKGGSMLLHWLLKKH